MSVVKSELKTELVSPRLMRSLVHPVPKANVVDVRFLDKGNKLFIAGYPSGVLQLFDVKTGKELSRIESPSGHRGSAHYVAIAPDEVTVYVPIERQKVVSLTLDGATRRRIELSGEVLVWNLATGEEMPSLKTTAPERSVLHASLSPSGRYMVTVERPSYDVEENPTDETILWDLRTSTADVLCPGYVLVAFSPDGKRLAAAPMTGDDAGHLYLLDVASKAKLSSRKPSAGESQRQWPLFSPDGRLLAVHESAGRINRGGTIRLLDASNLEELAAFDSEGAYPFREFKFTPDGRRLIATDYRGKVTVWDVAARRVAWSYSTGAETVGQAIAFSPDGRRFAVMGQSVSLAQWRASRDPDPEDLPQPRVFLFNIARSREPEILVCPHGYCGGLAFSPDGKTLAAGGAGRVHLFDVSGQ